MKSFPEHDSATLTTTPQPARAEVRADTGARTAPSSSVPIESARVADGAPGASAGSAQPRPPASPPGSQPPGLLPWFEAPNRAARDTHIVFGHWAALGLLERADVTALDTGCVWGGALTAVDLDDPEAPVVQVQCRASQVPGD